MTDPAIDRLFIAAMAFVAGGYFGFLMGVLVGRCRECK